MSRREIAYTWRVREIMARRGVHTAKELAALLHDRGITLTANAIWRIVTQEPERISFKVLVALCDALDVTPNDLITYSAAEAKTIRHRKAAGEDIPDLRNYRPVRARIVEDDG
ncbi:helix-turn-helix domain-containing protein [Paenarthrobacter aromaticivorans]|uniref:Helix-turn-helix transcriptional regulator n=1 Tax=Paenarthrobacter aromaticivorans TaxID=2849150 RepID=A0ABS6IBT4_9MICC|nr:helix-turn-helix transcriptional regulator [Paenarthrobacter sp. MMS21-TAE1-1]MBU8869187.1 helix-turn-helix transcriptional regulator [Paenarthrobacter sp. MMS21-TAE1-1]